ncbi:hypothetical protein Tco_0871210 [Tanacetum coccineum]
MTSRCPLLDQLDTLIVIGKLNEQIQSRGNTIRELKEKISRLTKKNRYTNVEGLATTFSLRSNFVISDLDVAFRKAPMLRPDIEGVES